MANHGRERRAGQFTSKGMPAGRSAGLAERVLPPSPTGGSGRARGGKGAGNLKRRGLYPESGASDAQLQSVVRWAAQHAPLQQLLLGPQPLSRDLWPDVVEAARLRPSLRILPSTVDYPDFG